MDGERDMHIHIYIYIYIYIYREREKDREKERERKQYCDRDLQRNTYCAEKKREARDKIWKLG